MPTEGIQPNFAPEEEISLSSLLASLCSDDELSDLALEGTDGRKVRTNRCILAARSVVFRRMLFGQYSEAERSVVTLGYTGRVLRAVVDYCYTDHASILGETVCDDSWVRTLVQLYAASDYFNLPLLGQKVLDLVRSKVTDDPALSCPVLDESEIIGDVAADLGRLALSTMRSVTQAALLPPDSSILEGVLALSPAVLSKVLQDTKLGTDEFTLFRALKLWADSNDELVIHMPGQVSKKRKEFAMEQARHISLKRIKPSDLCSSVAPSGLIPSGRLAEAFKDQALLLQQLEQKNVFIPTKRLPCWNIGKSTLAQSEAGVITSTLLQCEPMVSGVHLWAVKVEELCCEVTGFDEIGIASSIQSDNDWLSSATNRGWIFERRGGAWSNGRKTSKQKLFTKGSIIRFTLDLTTSGGLLSASVDGSDPFVLFENIIGPSEEKAPLFPAVSLGYPAAVRFLGFQRDEEDLK